MRRFIVVDGREFTPGPVTGIGRVLHGLLWALSDLDGCDKIILAVNSIDGVPQALKENRRIRLAKLSSSLFSSEKQLSALARRSASLFISPYPKLPLWGTGCLAVNIIHDVFYLTQPNHKNWIKTFLNVLRLRLALKSAALTWYDSYFSLKETRKLVGYAGKRPRVRYPGIDAKFRPEAGDDDQCVLQKYHLEPGFILVTGNGKPHKNLGVLLQIEGNLSRRLVFVGVSRACQRFWHAACPSARAVWIERLDDNELPALMRAAFCLAQPSTAEGYGYPPLEAMACGTPTIVSAISVLNETTGGQTLVADPHEPNAWIDTLTALEKPGTYCTQVDKGMRWVIPLRGEKAWDGYIKDISQVLFDH